MLRNVDEATLAEAFMSLWALSILKRKLRRGKRARVQVVRATATAAEFMPI